jgi:hypothetical protein
MRISYIHVKNNYKPLLRAIIFFLELGQSGCRQKIQNFMLISDLKKLFRENVPEKVRTKKIISGIEKLTLSKVNAFSFWKS